jgi:hypothetical protein
MSYSTISTTSDNVYVNVTFVNDGTNGNAPQAMEYKVTKTLPIISKCDDYYCSIVRFDIPLASVPLFIMPINPGSGTTQTTPMIIGIRTGGVDYPVNLIYVPDNTESPVDQTNPKVQIITSFYFCYTYQILINMINFALKTALTNAGLNSSTAYVFYEAPTKLINLVVDKVTFTDGFPSAPTATIFLNAQMLNYLEAIEVKFFGYNQLHGRDFEFVLSRSHIYTAPFDSTLALFQQEYTVLDYWSSIEKILITTNSIPIVSEFTPSNSSGIASTLPIITDFTPEVETAGQSRSTAYYFPTSQYRLVDLTSSIPLYTIDFKVYWQDRNSNIYPLSLDLFQNGSIKLGFFKKSLYNGNSHLLMK